MKLRHLFFEPAELDSLLSATHGNPFAFLGPHRVHDQWVIRVFAPHAREVAIVDAKDTDAGARRADQAHDAGFFEAVLPDAPQRPIIA